MRFVIAQAARIAVTTAFAASLAIGAQAQDAKPDANCDPERGMVDLEHCPEVVARVTVPSGVVRNITDGEYTITGPTFTGMRRYMGRTAVLDTGQARIVVTERNQEPWDRGVFESVGIRPEKQRYLLLKSRMYFRPVFLPIAKGSVLCDGVGVASSDWTQFTCRKVRRPIYPLDEV